MSKITEHYYGDMVRTLFLVGAIIMLLTLPFGPTITNVSSTMVLLVILLLSITAGITNPQQTWINIVNLGISLIAFIVFEYHALTNDFPSKNELIVPFFINQILAIIFLIAIYYSVKTVRGSFLKERR